MIGNMWKTSIPLRYALARFNPLEEMSRSSRHMACRTCRDRKVRCDGGQPSCEKCLRAGDTCIYVPASTPTRADLAQTVANLQERLAKAEAEILTQRSEVAGNAPVQHDQSKSDNNNFQFSGVDESPAFEITLSSPSAMSMSGLQPCPSVCNPQSDADHQGMMQTCHDEGMNWEILQSFLTSPPSMRIDFQPDRPSDDDDEASSSRSFQFPSLNEIRALNGNAKDNPDGPNQTVLDSRYKKVLAEFGDLLSSVFSTEAEIAGLSSAVADYLSWARKSPTQTDYPAVLQVLETRVRELNQLASTRYWAAFKQMRASFGRDESIQEHLRSLETGLIDQNVKTMQFFHEDYDISSPLAEQQRD